MAEGNTISDTDLQPADILVSTSSELISGVIRAGGFSKISHAKLYLGGGSVIESIKQGVVIRSLDESIAHDTLTIVLRHKNINPSIAAMVTRDALRYVGKPYDYAGVANASPTITKGVVISLLPIVRLATAYGQISNVINQDSKFFCSELVARMYEKANVKILNSPSYLTNPNMIYTATNLKYVGNLKGSEN